MIFRIGDCWLILALSAVIWSTLSLSKSLCGPQTFPKQRLLLTNPSNYKTIEVFSWNYTHWLWFILSRFGLMTRLQQPKKNYKKHFIRLRIWNLIVLLTLAFARSSVTSSARCLAAISVIPHGLLWTLGGYKENLLSQLCCTNHCSCDSI